MGFLTKARARIKTAYDPELFRQAGRMMADLLADHLSRVQQSRDNVLNWRAPEENVREADEALSGVESTTDLDELVHRFGHRAGQILQRGQNLHDPRYIGHQVPASAPIAALFDAVGSATNQVMAIYEMGPWATAVERAVIERLGRMIGWPAGSFAGLATHGGSLANLTALLTARNVRFPDSWRRGLQASSAPVLVAHGDAHYSITRAAGALGLGTDHVLRAELDDKRRIDPQRLDEQLQELQRSGRPVMAVSSCACATPIGAFDPLDDIADVCRRRDVWLHVDAAHGGAVAFSPRHRELLQGLDGADSLVWDAHKMLFVPALCAFVFYRERSHRFETFQQDAPYLFDPSAPGMAEYDSGLQTVECTKRAAVFGLWGLWSLFGEQLFADMVDVTFDVAQQFHELLQEAPDFEALHRPQCNIVAFRHLPEELRGADQEAIDRFQRQLRRDLIQSGEYYIVQSTLDGRAALRLTVCNPLTTIDTMRGLLDALRRRGAALLAAESRRRGAEETRWMKRTLENKVLVIVGGTTGLGLSAAKACVEDGARLVLTGRTEKSAQEAIRQLGEAAAPFLSDARDPESAASAIELARRRFGRFDGLYHVAGGSGRAFGDGPLHELTDEGVQQTLDWNLASVFYSNRAAVRAFLSHRTGGVVLNMGSVLGYSPAPQFFATHVYAAAKAAIIGMTKSAAAYYAKHGIRLNVLAPALVETPMARRAAEDESIQRYIATKQPLDGGRIGRSQDLDDAVVYLLSDRSRFMTGQVVAVDGGWSVSEGQIPHE